MTDEERQAIRPDQSFESFYRLWASDLERIASAYQYRFTEGWGRDAYADSYSAVNMVWWESVLGWKSSRGQFGPYFWSNWRNHMASIGRREGATKRPSGGYVAMDAIELLTWTDAYDLPECLTYTDDPAERLVIGMLSAGYRPGEVIEAVGGRRAYYRIVNEWKRNHEENQ